MNQPLALAHPVLSTVRQVSTWHDLPRLLPLDGVGPALEAWARLDEEFGDSAGAETHRALSDTRGLAVALGVEQAFNDHAQRVREVQPGEIRPLLLRMDTAFADWLRGDSEALFDAEQYWISEASSGWLEALPAPVRLSLCCDGAALHEAAFNRQPTAQTLNYLIGLLRHIVEAFRTYDARPPFCRLHLDPRLSRLSGRLAVALRQRYDVLGNENDLKRARQLLGKTLAIVHPSAPDFATWKLEGAVMMGYGDAPATSEVLTVLAEVAEAEPRRSSVRTRALELRGRAAWNRYLEAPTTHRRPWLDVAVEAWRLALAEWERPPTALRTALATALLARFLERGAEGPDAAAASDALGQLHTGTEASRLLDALAPEIGYRPSDLVDLGIEALGRLTGDPEARAVAERMAQFANLLAKHAPRLDADRRLAVRIHLLRSALALDDGPRRSMRGNELAVALHERFLSATNPDDLLAAIDAAAGAAEHPSIGPRDRVTARNTLSALLMRRYDVTGELTLLDAAVRSAQDAAVESDVLVLENRVRTLSNLVSALRARADRRGTGDDLIAAERWADEAVGLATGTDPETEAAARSIRATVRYDVWRRSRTPADIERAIADWRAVLVMDAPTHRAMAAYNLGNALLSGEDPAFLNESISLLSHAVRHLERALPEAATAANRLAEAFQRRASEADGEPANKSELRRATRWSERAVRWARGSSSETLMRVAWDWGGRASKAKDWESAATAYSAAIDALQALVQANRLVGAKESWLGEGFGIATRAAQSLTLSGRADEAVVALEQARGLLLLDALDKGSEGDPARVTFAEIRSALVQQLLYLVPGPDTGVALLVDPKKPHAIAVLLNGLSESSVGGRVRSFHISATAAARNPKAWQLALDRISTWLGEVITPAVEAMAPGRVTVVPTGALAFLPVHAARTSAGAWSFADTSIIEYAPAALPLVAARRRPTPRGPNTLLAVVEPRPTIEPPLPFAAEEALVAAMTADSGRILAGEDATVEEVLRALPAHRTVHIACHGRADIANPRASGVILRDDARLSVNRLAGLDLSGVRLVFLSACETGVPGADAPDEVIALGSAFFAAGVDAVISSMWQVPDLATLILVALFYDELRNSQDPALSLAAAQRRMRANTNAELRTELRQMRDAGRLPETTYLLLETELDALPPANQAFKGPDSWAGFAFVGCGAASRSAHERC